MSVIHNLFGPPTVNSRLTRSGLGCASGSPPVEALDAGLAHQAGHPLEVHRQAQPEHQLGVHPRRPVCLPRFLMDLSDLLEQHFVLLGARRFRPRQPLVIAGAGHAQHPTSHRDIDITVGVLG
jgi:hypothetical protein